MVNILSSAPSGLGLFLGVIPRALPWAIVFRPFRTWVCEHLFQRGDFAFRHLFQLPHPLQRDYWLFVKKFPLLDLAAAAGRFHTRFLHSRLWRAA
jgi:hypothetical protein